MTYSGLYQQIFVDLYLYYIALKNFMLKLKACPSKACLFNTIISDTLILKILVIPTNNSIKII